MTAGRLPVRPKTQNTSSMKNTLRACTALGSLALTSALFAGSHTYQLAMLDQTSSQTVHIEMFYSWDYNFQLINTSIGQTVASLTALCSGYENVQDWMYDSYSNGVSGDPYLYNSRGSWYLYDLPAGEYEMHVSSNSEPAYTYSLSAVYF
jgi:hypothetical protein